MKELKMSDSKSDSTLRVSVAIITIAMVVAICFTNQRISYLQSNTIRIEFPEGEQPRKFDEEKFKKEVAAMFGMTVEEAEANMSEEDKKNMQKSVDDYLSNFPNKSKGNQDDE